MWVEGDEFDGRSHHACMALINHHHRGSFVNGDAGIVDDDVIGWGIKPTIVAGQVTCWLLRYASSRNLGRKFTPRAPMAQGQNESAMDFQARKDAREKREGRDLPKAWAEWVRSVLCNNLGVVHTYDERLSTGNKTSRTSTVC